QLDDGASGNRVIEVDPVGRHGDQRQSAEARGGDERNLVQPGQGGAAEQGVVMVGGRREYRLGHVGDGQIGTTLNFDFSRGHATSRKSCGRRAANLVVVVTLPGTQAGNGY